MNNKPASVSGRKTLRRLVGATGFLVAMTAASIGTAATTSAAPAASSKSIASGYIAGSVPPPAATSGIRW